MKEFFRESGRKFLRKKCKLADDIYKHGGGAWQGLHTIYTYQPESWIEKAIAPFTINLKAAEDTRIRLYQYTDLIVDVLDQEGPRKYLDIACGSALGPIRAARRTRNKKASVKCTDISESALKFAKGMAMEEGVINNVDFSRYKAGMVDSMEPPDEYDGAGTHGHVDYLTPEEGTNLFKKIGKTIKPNGTLITTNMQDLGGLGKLMMEYFAKWNLKYKDRETLGNMLYDAGFYDIDVWETPLSYHVMGTGKKPET